MARLTRLRRPLVRVVTIADRPHVVRLTPDGLSLRPLGSRCRTATPISWAELDREGSVLDAAAAADRLLLRFAH